MRISGGGASCDTRIIVPEWDGPRVGPLPEDLFESDIFAACVSERP